MVSAPALRLILGSRATEGRDEDLTRRCEDAKEERDGVCEARVEGWARRFRSPHLHH